jgi:hypothetical protein
MKSMIFFPFKKVSLETFLSPKTVISVLNEITLRNSRDYKKLYDFKKFEAIIFESSFKAARWSLTSTNWGKFGGTIIEGTILEKKRGTTEISVIFKIKIKMWITLFLQGAFLIPMAIIFFNTGGFSFLIPALLLILPYIPMFFEFNSDCKDFMILLTENLEIEDFTAH